MSGGKTPDMAESLTLFVFLPKLELRTTISPPCLVFERSDTKHIRSDISRKDLYKNTDFLFSAYKKACSFENMAFLWQKPTKASWLFDKKYIFCTLKNNQIIF